MIVLEKVPIPEGVEHDHHRSKHGRDLRRNRLHTSIIRAVPGQNLRTKKSDHCHDSMVQPNGAFVPDKL